MTKQPNITTRPHTAQDAATLYHCHVSAISRRARRLGLGAKYLGQNQDGVIYVSETHGCVKNIRLSVVERDAWMVGKS